MNTSIRISAATFAIALAVAGNALAQTTIVSSTTSAGTISEFSPDTIVIRSETSPEPLRYTYSKTTTYVDEDGTPVSMETVKSGLPVSVQYVREGDRLIANRVIVRRKVVTAAPAAAVERTTTTTAAPAPAIVEEKKTTTTTTTTK